MKNIILLLIATLLLGAASCKQKGYPKPDNFISEKKMVDILYDIHMGEAIATRHRYSLADSLKVNSPDIYQAILDKYNLSDSILARNIIYYSSRPKMYEKVYEKVIERLNVQIEDRKQQKNLNVIKKQEAEE
jgi:hypothetical protein